MLELPYIPGLRNPVVVLSLKELDELLIRAAQKAAETVIERYNKRQGRKLKGGQNHKGNL